MYEIADPVELKKNNETHDPVDLEGRVKTIELFCISKKMAVLKKFLGMAWI